MLLEPGTTYGQYVIKGPLGAGAMGEVYLARDSRLGRDVAVKVLQPSLLSDPDAVVRFEREARALAAVQHPNIASIYGFEKWNGTHALVMEFVDGETLAKRLRRSSLPVPEALRIARQITSAIEGAHERGIVHRDLKPANVQIMRDGTVKVLDFGLARLVEPAAGTSSNSGESTATVEATRAGMILGTAAYMSPEQARGESADRRSDVWAFGCILYEMCAGRRAFGGSTNMDAFAAVLEREPDWERLPASLPVSIRKLLQRCLRKDAGRRPQHAGDIRIELDDVVNEPPEISPTRRFVVWRITALVAVATAVLALLWLGRTLRRPSELSPPTASDDPLRASITLPGDVRVTVGGMAVLAISGDGTTMVFSGLRGARRQLYIRKLNEFDVRPVPDTDDGAGPFFSPDGHWIGFFAHGQMKKVATTGGGAAPLAPAAFSRGATWTEDGTIIFTPEPDVALSRVSASGGPVRPLTMLDVGANELGHRWPQILPGGKAVIFAAYKGVESDSIICALPLPAGQRKVLISGGTSPFYVPDPRLSERGHIVYVREKELLAVPFDARRLEVTGPPYRIDAGVEQTATGAAALAVSSNGTVLYGSGDATPGDGLVWIDRRGQLQDALQERASFPRISPDGKRVLLTRMDRGNYDVWVYDVAMAQPTRLTFDNAFDAAAIWSPDNNRIAFRSFRGQPFSIFLKPSDGAAPEQRLTSAKANQIVHGWTRDGRLIYSEINAAGSWDLWAVSVNGDRTPQLLLPRVEGPVVAVPSPDDRWLAYTTTESGVPEVFVTRLPGARAPLSGKRVQISMGGGVEPLWSRDGSELFYRGVDNIMSVHVETDGELKTSPPQSLFRDPYLRFGEIVNYAVGPDGRFLMVRQSQPSSLQIRVVRNALRQ